MLLREKLAVINKKKDLERHEKNLEFIKTFKSAALGIQALLSGTSAIYTGARKSIDAVGKSIEQGTQGLFIQRLEEDGLVAAFQSRVHERNIAIEMWEVTAEGGRPGRSGDVQAQQIAAHIKEMQNNLVNRANRAGAGIKPIPGYIVRQSHNQRKIRRAGFEDWKKVIIDKLHPDTFVGIKDVNKFLFQTHQALATGVRFTTKGSGGSIVKLMGKERSLQFKSPEAWYDYNKQFGNQDLNTAVFSGVQHMAENISMMERLGSNPKDQLKKLKKAAMLELRESATKGDEFARKELAVLDSPKLDNILDVLDGTTREAAWHGLADASMGVRAWQSMSSLGQVVLSSISDIATVGAEMKYQGKGLLDSSLSGLKVAFQGRGNAEKREMARMIGVGQEGVLGSMYNRFTVEDGAPGTVSKMLRQFFKLSLMNWWNDSFKSGVTMMMAHDLAKSVKSTFTPEMIRVLKLYDIGADELPVLKQMVTQTPQTKSDIVMPESIQNVDKVVLIDYARRKGLDTQEAIDSLRDSLRSYYIDRADFAVPTPGAGEMALMTQGTKRGTVMGESLRFIMQFKAFPITYLSKLYGRETLGRVNEGVSQGGFTGFREGLKDGKGSMAGLAHLIISSTVLGYTAVAAKDLAAGRTPSDPSNEETWRRALIQGGGMGLYGDILLGEFNRYGQGFTATLLGPTASDIERVAEMYGKAKTGTLKGSELFSFFKSNTPYQNLFYTKAGFDYLIAFQIMDRLSPGYLRRLQSQQKQRGSEYIVPPSTFVR